MAETRPKRTFYGKPKRKGTRPAPKFNPIKSIPNTANPAVSGRQPYLGVGR